MGRIHICLLALVSTFCTPAIAAQRGVAYDSESVLEDTRKLLESPNLSWYHTWGFQSYPSFKGEFIPNIHSASDVKNPNLKAILNALPSSSKRLLTFNEPDVPVSDGGSAISAADAAQYYVQYILPLRTGSGRTWRISQPVVSSSTRGLDWLRAFNTACDKLNPQGGCAFDFVATHYFGPFDTFQWWVTEIRNLYTSRGATAAQSRLLFTEVGIQKVSVDLSFGMLKDVTNYLDKASDVDGYAWFGAYRPSKSHWWVGEGPCLFDNNGGLSAMGQFYSSGKSGRRWVA